MADSYLFKQLAEILAAAKRHGDPRLGGSLPLGGKAYADASGRYQQGLPTGPNSMFLTAVNPAEAQGYDQFMNIREAEMEDLQRRLGLPVGFK